MPLIVLRPEPGHGATVARARALGLDVISAPLFAIERVDWVPPDAAAFDALLLTSAHAVACAGAGLAALTHLPLWCVGAATSEAARQHGLTVARVGTAGVDALLADAPPARLLWLAGGERTVPTPRPGIEIAPVTVYRAVPLAVDPAALAGPAVVLVHSAAAAARLGSAAPERAALTLVTISAAVARAAGHGWAAIGVAATADDGAMVALAATLCKKGAATMDRDSD